MAVVGSGMIADHGLLNRIPFDAIEPLATQLSILHAAEIILYRGHHVLFVAYTMIPRISKTVMGYIHAMCYRWNLTLSSSAALTVDELSLDPDKRRALCYTTLYSC